MPTSTILFLTPTEDVALPATMGHLAHAAFLDLVRQADPDLSQRLHDQQRNVPFTCSRLIWGRRERRRGEREKGRKGEREEKEPAEAFSSALRFPANRWCWLRYTTLDDALFEVFTRRFLEQGEMSLRLGAGTFRVIQVTTLQDADDEESWSLWAGYSPYEEIWHWAEPHSLWAFHFASPTAFRARESRPRDHETTDHETTDHRPQTTRPPDHPNRKTAPSVTFPEPRRCFQSWLSRWNEFSPFPFERDPLLDFVEKRVVVAEHHLETRVMQFPRTRMVGFVGEAIFTVEGAADAAMLRQLDALAHFSFYAGTGYGTPKGMGQTRRAADKEIVARIKRREEQEEHP
jgi:CRISPR-associated endoribonuclease Cas6